MQVGEGFIIDNDHDPKPLYYQLLAELGQTFEWEYLQEGPDRWKVKLSRVSSGQAPTIGELVARDFRMAEVFEKYGIDFCCGGKKTVAEACHKRGVDVNLVERELQKVESLTGRNSHDFNSWTLGFLADYIVNNHHQYVARSLPFLHEISAKVALVHGALHQEVLEIARHFETIEQELEMHMHKEEVILFPYIKALAEAKENGTRLAPPPFGTIANPINMMEQEHSEVGNAMEEIEQLRNGFTPPDDACTSYRILYAKLQEFQQDLHQHIHLENNILFPKALKLESEAAKQQ